MTLLFQLIYQLKCRSLTFWNGSTNKINFILFWLLTHAETFGCTCRDWRSHWYLSLLSTQILHKYIYMYHAEISHVSHCYCPCRCNGFDQHKSLFLHKMTFNKLQRLDCTTWIQFMYFDFVNPNDPSIFHISFTLLDMRDDLYKYYLQRIMIWHDIETTLR